MPTTSRRREMKLLRRRRRKRTEHRRKIFALDHLKVDGQPKESDSDDSPQEAERPREGA